MGFAEDKVYDYILRNLSHFGNIQVTSLAHSLTCLTEADRDELQAREEMRGRHAAVFKFYQYLKCRRGWVLDLINALHQNNAGHLAEELQQLYDLYRVPSSAPASSSGTRMPSLGANPAPGAPTPEQPCRDPPAGSQPSLLPAGTPAASSAATSTDLDSRAPVQESLPKELPEQESPLSGSTACDAASDGLCGEGHVPRPADAVAMPPAGPSERSRDWPSRQQHPVCVDNGYFGNANHLNRGASALGPGRSLLSRDPAAARRNEPEEVHYVSAELPARAVDAGHIGELQPPDSLKTLQTQPACSSGHGEPSGSFVDVRNPLLIQKQFDAEQKQLRMPRDRGGDGDARVEATPPVSSAPTDTSTSSGASLKPPVQEGKVLAEERASSAPSVLTKEQVLPALAAPLLGTTVVGSFESVAGRTPQVSSAGNVQVLHSDADEDVELSKPGVLLSVVGDSTGVAGGCLGLQRPSSPYSGGTDRLELSSDPLMLSTDSSSPGKVLPRASLGCCSPAPAAHADPRGEEATRASSRPPPSWDSTSLGTHEVRVDHYPSVLLEAPQDLLEGVRPFGNPPAFDSSASSSQGRVPPRDSSGSSLSYIVPAAGIALISAVAFLVYSRLQK
ncbi:mitochondrial antiviral-signaling protein [Dromaius novaehollandiae]|uniref:mitochondrial antiviral-signaling protein n=1 Tax=Dromaius novaehollandiae TaxID=8790 RepID=UPI00312032DA